MVLSRLVQDLRLGELAQTEAARQTTLDALAGLDRVITDTSLDPVQAGRVNLAYARWADLRRVDLKATLTRQTEAFEVAQASARIAFGRNQALMQVAARQPGPKPRG